MILSRKKDQVILEMCYILTPKKKQEAAHVALST